MADTRDSGQPSPTKTGKGFSSAAYWKKRYQQGRNSGAGSYGRLAEYKADFINRLVIAEDIRSVIEFGSGDGNQAAMFTFPNYTGIDVSPDAVAACREKFADRPDWSFDLADASIQEKRDLAMSLDVIYHLIEDEVFDGYMRRLFDSASRFVLIYASDHDAGPDIAHVRHRHFSDWIAKNRADWILIDAPKHPYPLVPGSDPKQTSFASFKLFKVQGGQ
ncbi:MAG: class I SAM-dependent methyltransferase [Tabrizicola sp.]|nr:class I SAM-dependent methyltransferase [Tabrizicola sp.]